MLFALIGVAAVCHFVYSVASWQLFTFAQVRLVTQEFTFQK